MNKFVFLIHPRDTLDVTRRFRFSKFIPSQFIEFVMERLRGRAGFTVCSSFKVKRGGNEAEGYIVAVLLSGRQMMTLPIDKVRKRILDAIIYSQNNLKAGVIGLGSLTTSVTDGGRWVIKQPDINLSVTHGDTFTVAIAQEGISRILEKFHFNPKNHNVAVVGAYGLIGRELSVFLAQKGFQLILVESVPEKMELIRKRLIDEGLAQNINNISTDISAISDADFVIAATSHHSYLLKSENLKNRAVVYDIAQPMNINPELVKYRSDIVKIDGDYVDIGSLDLKFPMGPPKGSTFACLTETMMIALEGDSTSHVGSINNSFLDLTKKWGVKYGLNHAKFTSFGKPLNERA